MGGELDESQRFQVEEARDILGTWDMADPGGVSRETVLAAQVRALLAIVDQAFPGGPEPEAEEDDPLCRHCRKPIVRCDAVPSHAGCGSGHGWIHSLPGQWGHTCRPRSSAPYAQPETAAQAAGTET